MYLDNTRIRYFYHSIVIFKSLVDNINGSVIWKRNCIDGKDMIFGCSERVIPESGIFVDACICDSPLCNEKMGNIPETTTKSSMSTTTSSIPNTKPHSNLFYLFFLVCVIFSRYPIWYIFIWWPNNHNFVSMLICIFIETNYPKTIKTSFLCIVVLLWQ